MLQIPILQSIDKSIDIIVTIMTMIIIITLMTIIKLITMTNITMMLMMKVKRTITEIIMAI